LGLFCVSTAVALAACSRSPATPTPAPATPSGPVSLSGTVRDRLPSGTGAPVGGVLLTVAYKDADGPTAVSAADGTFQFTAVNAGVAFELKAAKDGYEPRAQQMSPLTAPATQDLSLTPIEVALGGRVTESVPTENTVVAGALIEITSGSNKGRSTSTDPSGAFTLSNVWGDFDVSVTANGFEGTTVHVTSGASPQLDVRLLPSEGRQVTTFTGDICTNLPVPDPVWHCTAPVERTYTFDVHRAGTLLLSVDYDFVGDYYSDTLTVRVSCASTVVVEKWVWAGSLGPTDWGDVGAIPVGHPMPMPLAIGLAQPCRYAIRLSDFRPELKSGVQTTYRVKVDAPR
jgi:hypothetical protein